VTARQRKAPAGSGAAVSFVLAADLTPYARNARTHSAEQVEQIASMIEKFGWTTPALVDQEGGLIAGHGRVMAAAKLYERGKTLLMADGTPIAPGCIPVNYAVGWSEDQKRAYVLADNQVALNAGWDQDLLKFELTALQVADFDMGLTGFVAADLTAIFAVEPEPLQLYSRKLDPPIYKPTGEKPKIETLANDEKARTLRAEIDAARKAGTIPADVATFLRKAADRHTVFDFHNIAEFYCHAPADVQRLFENSALVIIDFNSAIEKGFVHLTDKLAALVGDDEPPDA
jgi:hypothetical protein